MDNSEWTVLRPCVRLDDELAKNGGVRVPEMCSRTDRHAHRIFRLPPAGSPVWARRRCRISPPRFLVECCKRQLNHGSFVLLYFRLFTFSDLYCLSVFSCTVLFVSISQVIGCEDRLRNDLYCVEWGVKLYCNQPTQQGTGVDLL